MIQYFNTKHITKAFKGTNLKRTFKTTNVIGNLLTYKNRHSQTKYDNNGAYQLTCSDCRMKYVGQTYGSFKSSLKNMLDLSNIKIMNQNLPNTYPPMDGVCEI
jgi:hypothetical protein